MAIYTHVALPHGRSAVAKSNGLTLLKESNAVGGGMTTLSRQDLHDSRADQQEEVRRLRATCGDSPVPFCLHARAVLLPDALLTVCHALVSQ